ncbi:MAG: hypothetical protein C0392_14345 [Syntrophus sp. (in: bacteria)]|nr:hypothetical protein [Syntrophus sp. (in: bacteria)]
MENHFQEISDLKIPVQAVYNNTVELSDCRILYNNRTEKEFVLTTGNSDLAEGGKVSLRYGVGAKAYTFETYIKRVEACNQLSTFLHLSFPDNIKELERRRHFRVKPSQEKPITIKLHLPNNESIYIEALDISSSGISFGIPKEIGFFKTGTKCLIDVAIPRIGDLPLTGMVINTRHIFDVTCLGVEFQDITENERRMLTQYISIRELEARKENLVSRKHKETKISIVSDVENKEKYAFLYHRYVVRQIKPLGAIVELDDYVPTIMLLDCDISTTQILLHAIRKHAVLKSIPVILCGDAIKTIRNKGDFVTDMAEPINEKSFVKMVEKLVFMSMSAKAIKRRWDQFSGIGRKILIVDIFCNLGSRYIEYFSALNFAVIVVENEGAIMEKIQEHIPDYVLLDDESEKISIIDVCRLMNMNRTIKKIPKIFMTKDKESAKQYSREGLISGYVVKPFTPRQVFNEITNAFMKRITVVSPDQHVAP